MKKLIDQGTIIPAWYGIAWIEWQSNRAVCYPIGLNAIIALARNIYGTIRYAGKPVEMSPRAAYLQGFRDGKKSNG